MQDEVPDRNVTRTRVRYQETDQMGVVYHANYLAWFEIGRTEWMRELERPYAELEADGIRLAVVDVRCRYRSPARYDEVVEIHTRLVELTRLRVGFAYEIRRDGVCLAEGETTLAAIGLDGRPARIPGGLGERLRKRVAPGTDDRSGAN